MKKWKFKAWAGQEARDSVKEAKKSGEINVKVSPEALKELAAAESKGRRKKKPSPKKSPKKKSRKN